MRLLLIISGTNFEWSGEKGLLLIVSDCHPQCVRANTNDLPCFDRVWADQPAVTVLTSCENVCACIHESVHYTYCILRHWFIYVCVHTRKYVIDLFFKNSYCTVFWYTMGCVLMSQQSFDSENFQRSKRQKLPWIISIGSILGTRCEIRVVCF